MNIKLINRRINDLSASIRSTKYPKRWYFICYTILFLIMSSAIFGFFLKYGKSFVSVPDGAEQHLNSLIYYGRWLRQIVRSIFVDHQFKVPMWDMQVGYGTDIITTFNYYALGDPLAFFSIFIPIRFMGHFYNFLVIFRIFLAGVTFSTYAIYHKNEKFSTLIGAMIYCFCCFAISAGVKHPFFTNAMIYLPLVLLGIDKILKKQKPFLYIIMVAIMAMSNFYFMYMIGIFMIIYAIFRYFMVFGKFSLKQALGELWKFVLFSCVGILIAAVILLPVLNVLLSTNRFNADNQIDLLYESQFYWSFLKGFLAGGSGHWTRLGYTAVGLVGVLVLFIKKKTNTHLKVGFMLLTAFIFIPYAGHVLNGFSYVANRWTWAYSMLCAYMTVKAIPQMTQLNRKEKQKLVLVGAGLLILVLVNKTLRGTLLYFGLGMLIICIIGICIYSKKRYSEDLFRFILLGCACASLFVNAYAKYGISAGETVSSYLDVDKLGTYHTRNSANAVGALGDTTAFRYDQMLVRDWCNTNFYQNLNGTNYYFSLIDSNVSRFHGEMGLTNRTDYRFPNLNSRMILNKLLSVKYFLAEGDNLKWVPYGFDKNSRNQEEINGITCNVYEMDQPLSFGYTYDSYIPRSEYEKLAPADKQEALLQGAVLEESNLEQTKLSFQNQRLKSELVAGEGVELDGSNLIVRKKGATVTFQFEGLPNSEYYLNIVGLDIGIAKAQDRYTKEQWEGFSSEKRDKIEKKIKRKKIRSQFIYHITAGDTKRRMRFVTEMSPAYAGKRDFFCNMGYKEAPVNTMTVEFENTGYYSFEDFSVVCQPVAKIADQAKALDAQALTNVVIDGNQVTGEIGLTKEKILCFSIPYSKGWKLYVDGKEHQLKKANTMFLAAEVEAGEHQIRLEYQTPLLKVGFGLSILGLVSLAGITVYYKRKSKVGNYE